VTEETLVQAVAEELATVVGALLDAPGAVEAATGDAPSGLVVQLQLTGPTSATLSVGLDRAAAAQLARLVMGEAQDPPAAAIADTLQELCGQAIGALSQREGFQGVRLGEASVLQAAPSDRPERRQIVAGDRYTAVVSFWALVDAPAALVTAGTQASGAAAPLPPNLELILDIDLPLSVRFGETEMTLQSLTRLAPGSVIDLGRAPDDPVDVLVNGRLVARGEVVVVSGNYGVRIVEVVSPADRLKSIAA
jgi:flagellar motor switch protein FliN